MNAKYIFFTIVIASIITKPLVGMYITTKKPIRRPHYAKVNIPHKSIHFSLPCQKRIDNNKNNTSIKSKPNKIDREGAYKLALSLTIKNLSTKNNASNKEYSMTDFPFIERLTKDSLVRVECQCLIEDISSLQQNRDDLINKNKMDDLGAQNIVLLAKQIGQANYHVHNYSRYLEHFIELEQYLANVHNNGEMIFKTRREYCKHIIKNKSHISLKNLYQNFPMLVPIIFGSPCLSLPFLPFTSLSFSLFLSSIYSGAIFVHSITEPKRIPTKIQENCFMKLHETNRDLYNAIDKDAEIDKVFDLANVLYEEWQKNQNNEKSLKPVSIKKRVIKRTVDILKKYE